MCTDVSRPTPKTVAVAGATGRFGGLVEILLERGHRVRALTRDPESATALRLRARGAEIRLGDFDDPGSIARAADGADALFATGTSHRVGPEGELRHGRNVAGAAVEAAIAHLVYVSGDGAAADSPVPLFRAKFAVEHHIASLGISRTILAPVYLMENLFNPWNVPALHAGVLPSPLDISRPLQQAALGDVLALAALAIELPERFGGERIRVASDELSAVKAAAAISRAIGRELEPRRVSAATLAPGLRALFRWLSDVGHSVDVDALRARYPEIAWHDYARWIAGQRPRFSELCPDREPIAQ